MQAEGDLGGCKNLVEKMEALKKTILSTEKKIDKKGEKILDLTEYFYQGKQKAAAQGVKNGFYS